MQIRELLDELLTSLETGPLVTAVRHFDAKPAVFAPFPSSLDPRIVESLKARGVRQLYSHQVLQALVQQPESRVLYMFPTKALAQDQLAELGLLAKTLPDKRMFTYD